MPSDRDSINFAVRSLDLRSVKENSLNARRQVRLERSHALSAITGAAGSGSVPPPSVSFSSSFQQNLQQQKYGSSHVGHQNQNSSSHRHSLSASAATPLSGSGSGASTNIYNSNTAEARLAAATATAAVVEVSNLNDKIESLEKCLKSTIQSFTQLAKTADGALGSRSTFYAVTFGSGPIGMILTAKEQVGTEIVESIDVAELRDDPEGRPLLAKASGKITIGDSVLAINGNALSRYGPPSLEGVASEFKSATRPVTVLFERHNEN